MNESLKSSGTNLAQIGVPARFRFSTGDYGIRIDTRSVAWFVVIVVPSARAWS